MAKYLDEAGLVELAATIESNFLQKSQIGAGLVVNAQGKLQLHLGTGMALDISGGLTLSTNPAHLQEVANLLKPYIR